MSKLTDKCENPVSLPTQNIHFFKNGITSLIFLSDVKIISVFPINFSFIKFSSGN
ncbi:hypothetical protein OAS29_04705 [Candidatus Pelagibacter sp.]|nr:hypothetical protein [Candidatus Pelagibacter sp.]